MSEFLSSTLGKTIFSLVIVCLAIALIVLNYRLWVKAVIDFCLACVTLIVLAIPMTICYRILKRAIKNRKESVSVLTEKTAVGKDGKPFRYRIYTTKTSDGQYLSPICERIHDKGLDKWPLLFSVLRGKIALVGPYPITPHDALFLTDEEYERFNVRPGIISPCITSVHPLLFEEMFALDRKYSQKCRIGSDIGILCIGVVRWLRGENRNALSHIEGVSYADRLLAEGMISADQYREAENDVLKNMIH